MELHSVEQLRGFLYLLGAQFEIVLAAAFVHSLASPAVENGFIGGKLTKKP